MMLMEGTGLVEGLPTHVIMGTLLDLLGGQKELANHHGIGMDILSIAIVNTFSISFLFTAYKQLSVTFNNKHEKSIKI